LIPGRGKKFFSYTQDPDLFWGLSDAYQGPLSPKESHWGLKLTIQLPVVLRTRMHEVTKLFLQLNMAVPTAYLGGPGSNISLETGYLG
jgi:hypothetical protein